MTKREWDQVAESEFSSMPKEWQSDWQELRNIVSKAV